MLKQVSYQLWLLWGLLAALLILGTGVVSATTTHTSENYQITETQIGAGSSRNNCSDEYCASMSVGDTAVGDAESATYGARFGAIEAGEPVLEVITTAGTQNMGVLSTQTTATAAVSIKVRNYLSGGYRLLITGDTPNQGKHNLLSPIAPTGSVPGQEQFGINLTSNDDPGVGIGPVQVPSSSFSFGYVKPDYNIANNFMYSSGQTVAASDSSSGQTDYTLSMIVNISESTPGGQYSGWLSAVVVPVY